MRASTYSTTSLSRFDQIRDDTHPRTRRRGLPPGADQADALRDCYVQTIDRNIDPDIVRFAHLRTPSLPWQLFGYGRYGWSAKLTRGLTAKTRTGFQPWRGPARDRATVTPESAPFPTYKTRRIPPFASLLSKREVRPKPDCRCAEQRLGRFHRTPRCLAPPTRQRREFASRRPRVKEMISIGSSAARGG